MTLFSLRQDAESARSYFRSLLDDRRADEWTWFRAVDAMKGHAGRRNEDTSRDDELAADPDVRAAHDEYIRRLHAFYLARDGEGGVLGGRAP